jgi:hypothetical protein
MTSVPSLRARPLARVSRRPRLSRGLLLRARCARPGSHSSVVIVPLRNGTPTLWTFAVPSEVREALEYARRFRIEAHVDAHADAPVDTVDRLDEYCSFVDALVRARLIAPIGTDRPRHAPFVVAESVPTVTS